MKRLSPLKKRAGEGMGGLGGREKLLALERFNFEKGETRRRRHKTAAQRRPAQSERKNCAFSAKRQAVWFEMRSISN